MVGHAEDQLGLVEGCGWLDLDCVKVSGVEVLGGVVEVVLGGTVVL